MRAARGDLAVEAQFDLDDINSIFQDRAGLEVNGETFSPTRFGYRLTTATYAAPTRLSGRHAAGPAVPRTARRKPRSPPTIAAST